jgi:triphosphoribosyl-dephospho-CoA synthase
MTAQRAYTQRDIERAALNAWIVEVDALKPGNVHRFAGGHGMRYEDFVVSAEVSAPLLCAAGRPVGRRVLDSMEASRNAVGCNTNLGILLLCAPIAAAAESATGAARLRGAVGTVLGALHHVDAEEIYQAIRIARPGGLGEVKEHDVSARPDCSLLEAMSAAAERDLVARQYATGFRDIFESGLAGMREYLCRWNTVEWAAVGCYLRFLATFPDSHVRRKHGPDVAERVRKRAARVLKEFDKKKDPGESVGALLDFDNTLKGAGINPGTSADLTAACLMLVMLGA